MNDKNSSFNGIIRFRTSYYDCDSFELISINDETKRQKLSYAENNILQYLAQNCNEFIKKSSLERIGWPGRYVSNSYLTVLIASLRKKLLLDENVSIENIPNRGYRMKSIGYAGPIWCERQVEFKEKNETVQELATDVLSDSELHKENNVVQEYSFYTRHFLNLIKYVNRITPMLLVYICFMIVMFICIFIYETSVSFECNNEGLNVICYYDVRNISESNEKITIFDIENKHVKIIRHK